MNNEVSNLPSQLMRIHQEVVQTYREQVRELQIRVAKLEHELRSRDEVRTNKRKVENKI